MELDLKGKVAVITGGSTGIGLAVAKGLAAEGVEVALCARTKEKIEAAAAEVKKVHGVRTLGMVADVTRPAEIDAFVARVEKDFGGADILINNAGEGTGETVMDAPDERWQYYLDLLLMSAVRMSRSLVPSMRKRGGGVIINNASICALQPMFHESIYNTCKAAMVMFSKCLAHELIKDNIRVNCINPGLILTPSWQNWAEKSAKAEGITARECLDRIAVDYTPIGRFATAEELAHFFVFLCSDRASYCVGSSYYVDGGWLRVTT
ncbi:MAG TPA: SDR family oxidoreductase [Planctomycetota bacterium]|nr:SDR family oxidoreductase [Planctomycetota bacterium]